MTEQKLAQSLYQQVLDKNFDRLPASIQKLHSHQGTIWYQGQVRVEGPKNIGAKLLALLLGSPMQAGNGAVKFQLIAAPDEECWTRHFPIGTMTSRLKMTNRKLTEKLGAATLCFDLLATPDMLQMRLVKMAFFGIPCPSWLMPRIVAEECEQDQRFCFKVEAHVPIIGQVVGYQGFLELMNEGTTQ